MDANAVKLKILLDLIGKKKGLLSQILVICENQEALLAAERSEEYDKLFIDMGSEKQLLVNDVTDTDTFFQKIFSELGEDFERISNENKDVIKSLQEHVMTVTELDAKIRLTEGRNRDKIARTRAMPGQRDISEALKRQLLEHYRHHGKSQF